MSKRMTARLRDAFWLLVSGVCAILLCRNRDPRLV